MDFVALEYAPSSRPDTCLAGRRLVEIYHLSIRWTDSYSDEEALIRHRMREIELAAEIEREQYPTSWAWRNQF
jgi:hypothetical protein